MEHADQPPQQQQPAMGGGGGDGAAAAEPLNGGATVGVKRLYDEVAVGAAPPAHPSGGYDYAEVKRQQVEAPQQQQHHQEQQQQQWDGAAYAYQQQAEQQHEVAAAAPDPPLMPRETAYRIVVSLVDTALIIGRGGNTVRQIERDTGGWVGGVLMGAGIDAPSQPPPHPPTRTPPHPHLSPAQAAASSGCKSPQAPTSSW